LDVLSIDYRCATLYTEYQKGGDTMAGKKKRGSMNDLVFLEPNRLGSVPFTTSEVIAESAEVQHHTITRLIQQYQEDLECFGRVRFKIEPLQTRGGVQDHKVYQLNEEQATLLMTYLKNTSVVRGFKKELVKNTRKNAKNKDKKIEKLVTTIENRYYISSRQVNIEKFNIATRGHWSVEIKIHWHLDFTFCQFQNYMF